MFVAPATCSGGEEAVGIMVKPAEICMCRSYLFLIQVGFDIPPPRELSARGVKLGASPAAAM